jgi:hypothetical protein
MISLGGATIASNEEIPKNQPSFVDKALRHSWVAAWTRSSQAIVGGMTGIARGCKWSVRLRGMVTMVNAPVGLQKSAR